MSIDFTKQGPEFSSKDLQRCVNRIAHALQNGHTTEFTAQFNEVTKTYREMISFLTSVSKKCPETKFTLRIQSLSIRDAKDSLVARAALTKVASPGGVGPVALTYLSRDEFVRTVKAFGVANQVTQNFVDDVKREFYTMANNELRTFEFRTFAAAPANDYFFVRTIDPDTGLASEFYLTVARRELTPADRWAAQMRESDNENYAQDLTEALHLWANGNTKARRIKFFDKYFDAVLAVWFKMRGQLSQEAGMQEIDEEMRAFSDGLLSDVETIRGLMH